MEALTLELIRAGTKMVRSTEWHRTLKPKVAIESFIVPIGRQTPLPRQRSVEYQRPVPQRCFLRIGYRSLGDNADRADQAHHAEHAPMLIQGRARTLFAVLRDIGQS